MSSLFHAQQIPDWVERAAQDDPQRTAVRDDVGRCLSYHQLHQAVNECCHLLACAGVSRGNHVVFDLPAGVPFAVALHATVRCGAVAVLPDSRWTEKERQQLQLEGKPTFRGCAEKNAILPVVDAGSFAAEFLRWNVASDFSLQRHAVVTRMFTSGSTGNPKTVDLTVDNWLWNAIASSVALGFRQPHTWLCCLPVNHVGGVSILFRAAITGACVVIQQGFHVDAVFSELTLPRWQRPTFLSLVPTTLRRLLKADAQKLARADLDCILIGGAPLSDDLQQQTAELGLRTYITYGLTEAASHVLINGQPLFCTQVEITNQQELLMKSPTVAPGCVATDGWFHSGDRGRYEPDGKLAVNGRLSTTIISGGENVSPEEIEQVLLSYPGVLEALVYGKSDPEWGEAVTAAVEVDPDFFLSVEELQRYCQQRLARYKVPKTVEIVTQLPRTSIGKVKRMRKAQSLDGE